MADKSALSKQPGELQLNLTDSSEANGGKILLDTRGFGLFRPSMHFYYRRVTLHSTVTGYKGRPYILFTYKYKKPFRCPVKGSLS